MNRRKELVRIIKNINFMELIEGTFVFVKRLLK